MSKTELVMGGGAHEPQVPSGSTPWVVLIVDDEPEVHEVTHMLLARTQFRGAPVELHSAYSAVEAKTFLEEKQGTALILLDVVMETDDAGLQLCRYVRDELQNDDVQIVLRTGQPGQAPEKEVILNYDINGYFLKTEITSEKLHSILISSLRTYNYITTLKKYQQRLPRSERAPTGALKYRPDIAKKLRTAIERDELSLLAQPQIDLKNGSVVGVEVFLRWRTDEQIEIPPAEIIGIADRTGLTVPLDEWILRQACTMNKAWQDSGLKPFRIAVNVSSVQLKSGNLVAAVKRCLEETGLPPGCLELEVAESNFTENLEAGGAALRRLQELGVSITVDKFGIGLASLSQLKRLQPNRLKIDRSFVQVVTNDPDGAAITRAIIALAHTLGMSVVAEGVETKKQLEFLEWEECEVAQGYYFSPPMPTAHIPELLRSRDASLQ